MKCSWIISKDIETSERHQKLSSDKLNITVNKEGKLPIIKSRI